jgi:hypothetical protein
MKRCAKAWLVLITAVGGCVTTDTPTTMPPGGGAPGSGRCCSGGGPPMVPGVMGPYGEPVAMAAPYSRMPPPDDATARNMMANSMPLDAMPPGMMMGDPALMRTGGMPPPGAASNVMQASAMMSAGEKAGLQLAGGCPPGGCPPSMGPPGAVAALGALQPGAGGGGPQFNSSRTSVRFASPAGMKIAWYAPTPDGKTGFSSTQLEAPGRYNFLQGAIYRLKLSDVPNRPGLELYPTLEVVPANCKTYPFLAHSAVPVAFTDEDFDQVAAGNFVVKVIYLPDPHFQDLSTAVDEVVSSRLEPGVDPIAEAHRRGSILLVIRIGNIDLEAPNTPAMDAPCAYGPKPGMMPPGMAGMPGMPPGGMPPGMGGMPPGMMGGMPPGMGGGMPPGMMGGMPPGMMGGMPPGMGGGMPPGMMGGMPPGMGGMPPGGMPPGMMGGMPQGGMPPGMPMMGRGMVPMGPGGAMPPRGALMGNPPMLPNTMPPAGGPQNVPALPNLDGKQTNAGSTGVVPASTTAALAGKESAAKDAPPADKDKDKAAVATKKTPAKPKTGWFWSR